MAYTTEEVLSFVEENDVKFVRLVFCDLFGRGRNISLQSTELQRALTEGVSFDASAVRVCCTSPSRI
jgi:glutamine synthetase